MYLTLLGRITFVDHEDQLTPLYTIEPKLGRVVIFSSGQENPHYVERVTSGTRHVLAFWFTCYENKQFEIFLDGNAHVEFSHKVGNQYNNQLKAKSKKRRDENAAEKEL